MAQLNVDDVLYEIDDLSNDAKQQLAHVQFIDAEIARAQMTVATLQTARNAYVAALKEKLPKK